MKGQVGCFIFRQQADESRSQVIAIMNGLTDLRLLERTVPVARPLRTTYKLSRKGKTILELTKQMEKAI